MIEGIIYNEDVSPGLSIEIKYTKTGVDRGARESKFGPLIEPDEMKGYFEVLSVSLLSIPINLNYLDTDDRYADEETLCEDVAEQVAELIKNNIGAE